MSTEALEKGADSANSSADDLEEVVSDTRQFVVFASCDEIFAVDMAPVQEIIRMPDVVRVPLAPASLDGLANLRGKVLPIVSLRRIFGFADKEHDDATRVVVVDLGQALGFVVDRVASVVGVEPRQIEDVGDMSSTIDISLISGLIKEVGGYPMIMVLDFAKLIERNFAQIAAVAKVGGGSIGSAAGSESESIDKSSEELQLVSFHVAGQEYAVSIDDVEEIVQVPESIIHVPGTESHVLGVMTLRNRLLPLVSLRRIFALSDEALDEKSRIVVLAFENVTVGLAVDGVNEVLRVPKTSVEPMPALLTREGELAGVSEICRLGDGTRLVSIITARSLFDQGVIKEALDTVRGIEGEGGQDKVEEEEALDDDEQVVVFRLDAEEFGVPIASVQEIVRVPETLTRVPKAPASVEGVINLRGNVLPVIDLRRRLGLPRAERSDRQRIMVFLIGGLRTGFIVDQVSEVLKIPKSAIEASPRFSGDQGMLLSRMANLEKQKRIVQLIDPSRLVEGDELSEIAAATKESHDQAADSG